MIATSLKALRAEAEKSEPTRDIGDETMDQIRELLVGDIVRANEQRISALETRLNTLETNIGGRVTALQARIEALAGEMTGEQRAAFDQLAVNVRALGDQITRITRR